MEICLYQRPREKLQLSGAKALTTAELLQVLIGSGTAHMSGARIARAIEQLITQKQDLCLKDQLTYSLLLAVPGLGPAKACVILAAAEFGSRVAISSAADLHRQLATSARGMVG